MSRPRVLGRWSSALLALAPALAGAGCSLARPTTGSNITPVGDGIEGPVAHATYETRINHTDLLTIDVAFPATSPANGDPAGRFPTIVFLQDEGVSPASYQWLTDAIASWRFFVAIPHHVKDTPRYAPEDGSYAADLFISPPNGLLLGRVDTTQMTLIGHGEGGRIGAKILTDRPYVRFAMLGAKPDGGDLGRLGSFKGDWQAFIGTEDCKVSVAAAQELLGADKVSALEGVGHEQFAGKPAAPGCAANVSDEVARPLIRAALKRFLLGDLAEGNADAGSDGGPGEGDAGAALGDAAPAATDTAASGTADGDSTDAATTEGGAS